MDSPLPHPIHTLRQTSCIIANDTKSHGYDWKFKVFFKKKEDISRSA